MRIFIGCCCHPRRFRHRRCRRCLSTVVARAVAAIATAVVTIAVFTDAVCAFTVAVVTVAILVVAAVAAAVAIVAAAVAVARDFFSQGPNHAITTFSHRDRIA